jgi:hypothetical protein
MVDGTLLNIREEGTEKQQTMSDWIYFLDRKHCRRRNDEEDEDRRRDTHCSTYLDLFGGYVRLLTTCSSGLELCLELCLQLLLDLLLQLRIGSRIRLLHDSGGSGVSGSIAFSRTFHCH